MMKNSNTKFEKYILRLKLLPFVYLVSGVLWITITDWIVFNFRFEFPSLESISTFKGWLFVGVTFFCLQVLIRRAVIKLRDANDQIATLSLRDQLTELPNRHVFIDRIERLIISSKRQNTIFGIIFLDIDDFKLVNDTLGHVMGDTLLKEFGQRLTSAVRQTDTVSRFGGDEFLILAANISSENDLDLVVTKIRNVLNSRFLREHNENLEIRASLGSALFPRDGDSLEELLQHADRNMYQSKMKQ